MNMKKYLGLLVVVLLSAGLLTACGSSSGSNPAAGATVETAGSSGAWTINMMGGKGATGGYGGYWYMETYQQQGVKLMNAGTAATGFTVPSYNPTFDPGTNACTVSGNIVVSRQASDPGAGVLYVVGTYGNLFKGTGTGSVTDPAKECTSLKVNAGATLTVGLNTDSDSNTVYDEADLVFANDVMVAGTLKTADLTTGGGTADARHGATGTTRDMGALYIEAQQVMISSTGSIITKGLNGTSGGQRGGDGGEIYISANNYFINQGTMDNSGGNGFDQTASSTTVGGYAGVLSYNGYQYTEIYVNGGTGPSSPGGGVFVNTGKIISNGGNGSVGGEPAEAYIYVYSDVFNTGPISANGGKGVNGTGGNGYWDINIYSEYGSIFNSGALSQAGGNGTTGGGYGGYVYLYAGANGYVGDIVNSGPITVDSGSATVSGSGGGPSNIYMYAYGAIKTSGKLSANGGDSMGSNAGTSGGELYLENYVPYDYGYGEYLPVRPIQVSGNIYLNGGSSVSGTGGAAGPFYVYQTESSDAASNTGIQLLGYASANLSGGFGTTTGGAPYGNGSWSSEIYTYNDYSGYGYTPAPPGPIFNQIKIIAKGGDSNGAGGGGNYGFEWYTSASYYGTGTNAISTVTNAGVLDSSGGNGAAGNGGNAGEIYLYGHDGFTNSGSIFAKGGNGVGATGGTGASGGVWLYASLNIVNSGQINTTGGSGATGGNGSSWGSTPFGEWVQLDAGGKVTNTGPIICNGGAGSTLNGNGGGIDIMSESGGTSNSGTLSVAKGAGAGAVGTNGQIWIDWVQKK